VALFTALAREILAETGFPIRTPGALVLTLLPVALLVLNPPWLISATQAEVYAGWYAWLAGALLYSLHLMRIGSRPDAARALGWGVLCGIGVVQHALSVLFIVPLTVGIAAAWIRSGRARVSLVGAFAVGLLPPLASLGFIAYRAFHPAAFQWPLEPTWASVASHLRGGAYAGYLGRFAPNPSQVRLLDQAVLPYLLPGLALSIVWALRAASATLRGWLLAALVGCAALLAFVVRYGVPDPAAYLTAATMVACLAAIPVGRAVARRVGRWAPVALLALVVIGCGTWSVGQAIAERHRLSRVDGRIRAAWRAIPFDSGIVLWADDHYTRLEMLQRLEGSRPGLVIGNPYQLTWPAARRDFAARAGADPLAGLEIRSTADVGLIASNVRRQSALPVVDFRDLLEGRSASGPR